MDPARRGATFLVGLLALQRVTAFVAPPLLPGVTGPGGRARAAVSTSSGLKMTGEERPRQYAREKTAPALPQLVPVGAPLELWHQSKLSFGYYEGRNAGKASLRVRLAGGGVISIDVGQIVNVWEGEADWAALAQGGEALLQGLTAKALDLDEFWAIAMAEWKHSKVGVGSYDLATYLFHRPLYKRLHHGKQQFTIHVKPEQRYAAAVLLALEVFRFKRMVSTEAPAEADTADDSRPLRVLGGGYKPLAASVADSREVLSFVSAVKLAQAGQTTAAAAGDEAPKASSSSFWDATQWRMLHHLEVFALGESCLPALPPLLVYRMTVLYYPESMVVRRDAGGRLLTWV
jgi:hypothetical protein